MVLRNKLLVSGMMLLVLVGCRPLDVPSQDQATVAPTATVPAPTALASDTPAPAAVASETPAAQTDAGTPVLVPATEAPIIGPVSSDLLKAIGADLEQRSGVKQDMAQLIRAEATIWNDGSMGCPQPGVAYTEALVDGFWIVYQVGADTYDYRAATSGYFFLCAPAAGGRIIQSTPYLVAPATPTP